MESIWLNVMDLFDYLVVGSGPSGVAAARQLAGGRSVCIIDVADTAVREFKYNSLDQALSSGDTQGVLGQGFEFLTGVADKSRFHTKLKSESLKHILRGDAIHVRQDNKILLNTAGSFAKGGMSNVWGAQLLRYTQEDFDHLGWPINYCQLAPYYTELEKHIGISGVDDDMKSFFGDSHISLPPTQIVPAARSILDRYESKKIKNCSALILGRGRLAVLTESYRGYSAHKFGQTDFFSEHKSSVFSSKRTLNELIVENKIIYKARYKVVNFTEYDDHVEVNALNLQNGHYETFKARHLLLGCGTAQTSKMVLMSRNGSGVKLPFIDHPPLLIPFFLPNLFGAELARASYPIQLTGTLRNFSQKPMISFYYPGGMIFTDLLFDMPFSWQINLRILKTILSGMLVAQVWFPSNPSSNNYLYLDSANDIVVNYDDVAVLDSFTTLFKEMRSLGAYSNKKLITKSPPVWGFHHAGTLPMSAAPQRFQTHIDGRLWDSRRVRVIDGAVLPSLPSKNHSLTIMANAARIADEVIKCGY
jgi:choline dehydrogenase-like flavoprotein